VGIYSTSLHETIQRISWRVYCSCNFYSFDISLTCDSLPQPLRLTGHPAARNSSESSPWTHWYGRNHAPNTSAFHGSDQQSIFGTETWQSPVFFVFFHVSEVSNVLRWEQLSEHLGFTRARCVKASGSTLPIFPPWTLHSAAWGFEDWPGKLQEMGVCKGKNHRNI
jgi:hypothetical protein